MKHQGFTLIEFVVIISIFAIMAGVALVNFAGFRSNVGLNNLAHDIALTVRQAQVFGWATRSSNNLNPDDPNNNPNNPGIIGLEGGDESGNPVRYADGVYFNYENGAFAKEFILYTKNNSTAGTEYFIENSDEVIDTIKIQGPNHISGIRYGDEKSDLLPDQAGTIPGANGLIEVPFSIAFSRPHPEALFFSNMTPLNNSDSNFVGIYISADDAAPNTAQHVITISRFGEIAVQ